VITFDDARAVVAASESVRQMAGDFTVADYGWENPDVYLVVALPNSGEAIIDGPDLLVDKRTGKLTEVFGMLGRDPVAGLRPVGTPPD
jgi:hypothetical protein